MRVTVAQHVRGVLDVKGDITGIRTVAESRSFPDHRELQVRLSALAAPDEEGLAYLGMVADRMLFCRFEPYDGPGGRYTQVRGMAVSGVSACSFCLRDLATKLPAKEFYTRERELADHTFEIEARPPRWGEHSLRDELAPQIVDLLAGFVTAGRILLETHAKRVAEAAGCVHDVWSLLPPTLRNGVTFTVCGEPKNWPESPLIQLTTNRYVGDNDLFRVHQSGVAPAAAAVASSLVGLLRKGLDLSALHTEVDRALSPPYRPSPAEALAATAAVVDEWQTWIGLRDGGFALPPLRAYLDKSEESRVRRVADAIADGDVALAGVILGNLPPAAMQAVGAALVRRPTFNDDLVVKLEKSMKGLEAQTTDVWRGLVGQVARAAPKEKPVTIERVWRLLRPEPPVALESLFLRFRHDCGEADEDFGWWRWIDESNAVDSSRDFRAHLPKCKLPLRWAYLLAAGELTPDEQKLLMAEASNPASADAVAQFLEEWLEAKRPIPAARLQPRVPLFIAALRKSQGRHPQLARTVAQLFSSLLKNDELNLVTEHLAGAVDELTAITMQLCEVRQLALQALQGLQAVRDTQGVETAARLVPLDPSLLPFLTLLAMAGNDLSPAVLEVLGAAQAQLGQRLGAGEVERLATRIGFHSAEQALAYAWLIEWLTQRPGAAGEVIAQSGLEHQHQHLLELLEGMIVRLAEGSSPIDEPSERRSGKGWSIPGWLMGDR
ncbi:MAG TPA: hypothetical protein VGS57_18425 [Thermoanaerobaculia bacterium]|jgi:hypothetical protein|nr:hypothetical protein [Thermoanaerobaculia bacterium]